MTGYESECSGPIDAPPKGAADLRAAQAQQSADGPANVRSDIGAGGRTVQRYAHGDPPPSSGPSLSRRPESKTHGGGSGDHGGIVLDPSLMARIEQEWNHAVPGDRDDGGLATDLSAEARQGIGESAELAGEHTEHGYEHGQGDDQARASRDRDRLNERLDDLSLTLAELRGQSNDLDQRVEEIQHDIADLKAIINDLVGSGGGQSPGATFQPVAQLSVIEDDTFAAAKDTTEDDDSARQGFFKRLRRLFRGIWALLWRMLSRFKTVKEWSVSGELGPAAFMGKVGVSVTFGR